MFQRVQSTSIAMNIRAFKVLAEYTPATYMGLRVCSLHPDHARIPLL